MTSASASDNGLERRSTRSCPTAPTTQRIGEYAGRWVKDADHDLIEDLAARGKLLQERALRALLSALLALRHAAALLRQAVLVHRHEPDQGPAAGRPTRTSTGSLRTSSTAASASGLRATSTGRCRGSATGARRCRCWRCPTGHLHVIGSLAELSAVSRRDARGPAPPVRRRRHLPVRRVRRGDAPRPGGDRCLVRLGLDAVRPVRLAARPALIISRRTSRPTTSARRLTRPAAGSTRCSPSRRCCSRRARIKSVVCLGLILDRGRASR